MYKPLQDSTDLEQKLENNAPKVSSKRAKFADQESQINSSIESNPQFKEWHSYKTNEKLLFIFYSIIKIVLFIILLYMFLVSLNLMSIGFGMVSRYAIKAGDMIRFLLSNPFAALAIGIIATAIIQNSTATTSIAVSMVGAGIIPSVKSAIPIIMGSNIGACVTNSLIALTLSGKPDEFRRAFSAATLNDIFNFLTTIILLPIEIIFNFLFITSNEITNLIPLEDKEQIDKAKFMNKILDPIVNVFIMLNETAVDELSSGNRNITRVSLNCCHYRRSTSRNESTLPFKCINCNYLSLPIIEKFGEGVTGLFWIIISLVILIICLFAIVKVLSLFITGPIAKGVRIAINGSFPGYLKLFSSMLLFLIPLLLTLIVQSSSIITATLVPLCGIGMISLHRVFVMTLGSNIGTTVTGLISAFTQPPSSIKKALQLAFVNTLFNVIGVLLWLPVSYLRLPKKWARKLGNASYKYKWFLYMYVLLSYFIVPLILFGLALIPYWIGIAFVGIPVLVLTVTFAIIKLIILVFNDSLTDEFKSYTWLPIWMKSLKPYDQFIQNIQSKYNKYFNILANSKNDYLLIDDEAANRPSEFKNSRIVTAIRKYSVIDSLINEAKLHKEIYGVNLENDSSSELDEDDNFDLDRRKSCNF